MWVPDWEDGRRWEILNANGRVLGRIVKFTHTAGYYAAPEAKNDICFGTMREAAVWLLNSLKAPG